jgi:hypothetical protein
VAAAVCHMGAVSERNAPTAGLGAQRESLASGHMSVLLFSILYNLSEAL